MPGGGSSVMVVRMTRVLVRAARLGPALLLLVLACGVASGDETAARPPGRKAPRITGDAWINSKPLLPKDLAGRVRLVEFWAFECVNCRRTLPAMRSLFERYPSGGDVVIVAVHTPELPREREVANVKKAVVELKVPYPVVLDPEYSNWRAFENQYWPALYVIDRRGVIRDVHVGELHEDSPAWKALLEEIEALRREPA